jgi:hypothetical protein
LHCRCTIQATLLLLGNFVVGQVSKAGKDRLIGNLNHRPLDLGY